MFYEVKNPSTNIKVGGKTRIGDKVVLGPNCKNIEIGYGCFIGNETYIDVEELVIGDYTTIHHGSIIHGIKTKIGHNCWFGHYTIIDSLGGNTVIGNNVGVGAHSQLWSHMKFGDTLFGCRWNSAGELILEDDVWLVGHSIVGPIHAHKKAMLMTGSVAVKDMEENKIYSGSPAKDISGALGLQFEETDINAITESFEKLKNQFSEETGINSERFVIVDEFSDDRGDDYTEFNLNTREYKPVRTEEEFNFLKFLLYDKAKFVPHEEKSEKSL